MNTRRKIFIYLIKQFIIGFVIKYCKQYKKSIGVIFSDRRKKEYSSKRPLQIEVEKYEEKYKRKREGETCIRDWSVWWLKELGSVESIKDMEYYNTESTV